MITIRSLRDLVRLFFIYRREFLWACALTMLMAVLAAFLLPSRYESQARLLIKPGRENTTLPIEAADRQTIFSPVTQRDPILDEEKMFTGGPISRTVAQYYLERMQDAPPRGFWRTIKHHIGAASGWLLERLRDLLILLGLVEDQPVVDRLAKRLLKNMSVSHEPGSAVMEIRFRWDDPVIAQEVVRAWVDAYLQDRTEALSRNSLHGFYEQEADKAAERIATLKSERLERLRQLKAVSTAERLESLTVQINRLNEDLLSKTNDRAGIQRLLVDARAELRKQPREVITEREISLNPTQQDLKLKLNELEQSRARLLRTYTEEAPPVQDIDAQITAMRQLIEQHNERLERSRNVAPNSIVSKLAQDIVDAELQDSRLVGQIADYQEQIESLRQQRLDVQAQEPEILRLSMELDNAEKSYALYAANVEKARIDRELDLNQISNVAIIEAATINRSRVFPKSLLILLMALPAGIAVGCLAIYLCYLLDQRIHDADGLEQRLGVPVWATLEDLGESPWHPDNVFIASLSRLYNLLPLRNVATQGVTVAFTSAARGEGTQFVAHFLKRALEARGLQVLLNEQQAPAAGQVRLLTVPHLLSDDQAFPRLQRADVIVLVVQASATTLPVVTQVLSLLRTAFGRVDGIILNRHSFSLPRRVQRILGRWSAA
ncbi:lipopolysaccharide biosynthesis protein [Corticibacter populi]|uniref:Lipopolysaccharide biosynthesis protein n=1 Tax=Corticibacter populi TaxID=1550736 RepID=A0A3M6QKH9_9BURK|nr:GNVR domain-containing protein [Corticibacter populi]RMX03533.1 lipopolysaccharide biosynthesis protein [Corticibacter populi]RZS29984.1 uncharacterized protein involved in exopolysaccharide biosynthesis [Corticibacter populi]